VRQGKRWRPALALAAVAWLVAARARPADPPRPRVALWVPCEGSVRVLDDPVARIPKLIADAKALGATDLFVQSYRGGRAWYDSAIADATPYRGARERMRRRSVRGAAHGRAWSGPARARVDERAPRSPRTSRPRCSRGSAAATP
jgi:hypothetical protein